MLIRAALNACPWSWRMPTRINARTAAGLVVAAAMLSSTIVFSEPAVVDALLAGVIFAVPVLAAGRLGKATLLNAVLWLVIIGAGIAATMWSTTFDTAIKHQVVTLFLAASSVALAAFVAAEPEPWLNRLLWCYLAACLLATVAALVGYFRILPAAYDLFTNYGRARGTFKDPNVYGAALVPALTFAAWMVLRGTPRQAQIAAALAVPLLAGLLLSFSRGAWFAAVLSIGIVAVVLLFGSRRSADLKRFGIAGGLSVTILLAAIAGALQIEAVSTLLLERASLDQSYDQGPQGRFGGQQKAVALVIENPLGIGTHTFRESHHPEEAHNVYLTTFLNAGWIGGLFYILSVVITIAMGFRAALGKTPLSGLALVVTASFTAIAIEGFVIDSDHWRHFFILMALIWGVSDARPAAAAVHTRRSGDPTPDARPLTQSGTAPAIARTREHALKPPRRETRLTATPPLAPDHRASTPTLSPKKPPVAKPERAQKPAAPTTSMPAQRKTPQSASTTRQRSKGPPSAHNQQCEQVLAGEKSPHRTAKPSAPKPQPRTPKPVATPQTPHATPGQHKSPRDASAPSQRAKAPPPPQQPQHGRKPSGSKAPPHVAKPSARSSQQRPQKPASPPPAGATSPASRGTPPNAAAPGNARTSHKR